MAIPPGIRAAVYSKDEWAKASKNEKIDETKLKPIELHYSLCHPAGCTAETEATPEILSEMAKGGGIMVLAMNASAQPVGFPVPLDGYNEAASGPPVDNKKYAEARSALMKQIRERQQKLAEDQKELEDQTTLSGVEGCVADPCNMGWPANDIRPVANSEFLESNPAVRALLENVAIPIEDIFVQNARMNDGEDSPEDLERHASEWIADHRDLVDQWLAAAREAAS